MESVSEVKISRRIWAYLLDIVFIFFVVSLITSIKFINPSYEKYEKTYEKYSEVVEEYSKGNLTEKEFIEQNRDNYYYLNKYTISYNIAIIVVIIAYFVLFQKFNGGQTIGKQIMKLKVVNLEGKDASLISHLLRTTFSFYIYVGSIIPLLINTILVFVLNSKYYMNVSYIVSYGYLIFAIISLVMMCKRKDKRGLHELISKTKVINVQ